MECQDIVFQGACTFKAHTPGDALFLYDCSFSSGGTTISGFVSTGGPTITSSVIYACNFQGNLTLDTANNGNAALNINSCNITGNLYYTSTGTYDRTDSITNTAIYGNLVINNTSTGPMVLTTDAVTLPVASRITNIAGTVSIILQTDSNSLAYTPTTSANWPSTPTTAQAAFDILAANKGSQAYQNISSSTSITAVGKIYFVNASSGSITITLPLANTATSGFTPVMNIKRTDSTLANTVTIVRSGSNLIDGATSITLSNYDSITLTTDTNNWFII
jgi:hypothetical protein